MPTGHIRGHLVPNTKFDMARLFLPRYCTRSCTVLVAKVETIAVASSFFLCYTSVASGRDNQDKRVPLYLGMRAQTKHASKPTPSN